MQKCRFHTCMHLAGSFVVVSGYMSAHPALPLHRKQKHRYAHTSRPCTNMQEITHVTFFRRSENVGSELSFSSLSSFSSSSFAVPECCTFPFRCTIVCAMFPALYFASSRSRALCVLMRARSGEASIAKPAPTPEPRGTLEEEEED